MKQLGRFAITMIRYICTVQILLIMQVERCRILGPKLGDTGGPAVDAVPVPLLML